MAGRDWHPGHSEHDGLPDDEAIEFDEDEEWEIDPDESDYARDERFGTPTVPLLPPPSSFSWTWFTTSLVALAILFFLELGIHPAIAAVALCFKLSLPDLLNAWWLLRRDPRRGRGVLLAMFYAARAFWGVVGYSFGLMLVLSITAAILENPGRAAPVDLNMVGFALSLTFVLMSMAAGACSVLLCLVAMLSRVRIWLAPEVTPWRRLNHFPPFPPGYHRGKNQVLRFAYVTSIAAVALGLTIGLSAAFVRQPGNGANPGEFLVLIFGTIVGSAIIMLTAPGWISSRIAATSPEACWELSGEERQRVERANGPSSMAAGNRESSDGDGDAAWPDEDI